MATVSLKGIWGLEQLDQAELATWKLGVLLMGGGVLIGLVLIPMLGEVRPDIALTPPKVISLLVVVTSSVSGFYLFCTLALARSTEAELRLLSLLDDTVNEGIAMLHPTAKTLGLSILATVVTFQILAIVMDIVIFDMSVVERFSRIHSSGLVLNVVVYLMLPIAGTIGGILLAIFIAQSKSLVYVARNIEVNLLLLSQYSTIANPAVRFVILVLAVGSLGPPMILFGNDPTIASGTTLIMMVAFLVFTPILFLYIYPVFLLKERIRNAKETELKTVLQVLQGDDEATKNITIQGQGLPKTTADLLLHQIFVESRWEWPVASHVQKLILFGLLPPLTWVLTAIIENTLY